MLARPYTGTAIFGLAFLPVEFHVPLDDLPKE